MVVRVVVVAVVVSSLAMAGDIGGQGLKVTCGTPVLVFPAAEVFSVQERYRLAEGESPE